MRVANLIALLTPMVVACATRRDTGNAMVVGGAAVATMAAMSSGRMVCGAAGPCAAQGSKTGAAVAAAGMGVAIAGHAIAESGRRENAFAPRPASSEEHAPLYWNLVRPDEPDAAVPASSAAPPTP